MATSLAPPPPDRRVRDAGRDASPLRRAVAGLVVVCAALAAGAAWAVPAAAHAELTSTDPENLATVTTPVQEVRFTFSKASEPVAERFSVRGPDGPVAVAGVESLEAGTVVLLRLAEPLDSGRYRVGWGIRAGDSHSMNGAIAFTVDAASAATGGATPGDAAAGAAATGGIATTGGVAPGADDPQAPTTSLRERDPLDEPSARSATGAATDGTTDAALLEDEPLGAVAGATEERVADIVRGLLYLALLGAVGGVVYLAAVYRGARSESTRIVRLVRTPAAAVGVLAVAAAVMEVVVLAGGSWSSILDPSAWTDTLSGNLGIATLLRLLGAAGVALFVAGHVERVVDVTGSGPSVDGAPSSDPTTDPSVEATPAATLPGDSGGGVAVARPVVRRRRRRRDDLVRVVPSPIAWLGALALLASETFTGHTAATDPRWLVATSDVVHLAAASVWATGAALLCWTLWQRSRVRPGDPLAPSVLRFSTLAGWALLAVTVTGAVQAGLILGSVEALVSTTFGRVLGVKVLVVAAITWTGWWNRRHLVPEFATGSPPASVVRQLRTSLTVEAIGFLVVVALTAVLVVASPV